MRMGIILKDGKVYKILAERPEEVIVTVLEAEAPFAQEVWDAKNIMQLVTIKTPLDDAPLLEAA